MPPLISVFGRVFGLIWLILRLLQQKQAPNGEIGGSVSKNQRGGGGGGSTLPPVIGGVDFDILSSYNEFLFLLNANLNTKTKKKGRPFWNQLVSVFVFISILSYPPNEEIVYRGWHFFARISY